MKVLISGYYGFGNLGDEALLEALVEGLREREPGIEITVLSKDPTQTAEVYKVETVSRYDFPQIIKTLRAADVFISGGGGLLQDVTSFRTIPYYLGLIRLAKLMGKKVAVLGQGFGPVRSSFNKVLVKRILNQVDLITLRDEKSYQDLLALGVSRPPIFLTADLTFNLEPLDKETARRLLLKEGIVKGESPLVGLSLRSPSEGRLDYKAIAEAADYLAEKEKAKILFLPFRAPSDVEESAKVINLMSSPANVLLRAYKPREMLAIISLLDLLIGMRLHALIFGAITNVPVIGLSYDPKVEALLGEIQQPCLKIEKLKPDLLPMLKEVWAKKKAGEIRDLKSKARSNFDLFFEHAQPDKKIEILGVKVDNVDLSEASSRAGEFVERRLPHLIVTPNPEMMVAAQKDSELKNILNSADLKVPDGVGLILASRMIGRSFKERVTGIDLMLKILELAERKGFSIYLLGSRPGMAEAAVEKLKIKYEKLKIVGFHHGYFTTEEEPDLIEKIRDLKPDILFAGLGAGRQEKWLAKYYKILNIPVVMGIGGSLDVIAGKIRRAPEWVQKWNLEWLYRLITEPRRWKRQLALFKFLAMVIKPK